MKVYKDCEYPQEIKDIIENKIKPYYSYSIRSTDFWDILQKILGVDEWMIMDMKLIQNGFFDAYIMDQVKNIIQGESVETEDVYKVLLKTGEFTSSEIRLMERNNINNILCAMLLAMSGVNY